MAEIIALGNQVFEAHRRDSADRVRKGIADDGRWLIDSFSLPTVTQRPSRR